MLCEGQLLTTKVSQANLCIDTSLVKEAASLLQHKLQLNKLIVAACQTLAVAIDLQHLSLKLFQLSLQQEHGRTPSQSDKNDCRLYYHLTERGRHVPCCCLLEAVLPESVPLACAVDCALLGRPHPRRKTGQVM